MRRALLLSMVVLVAVGAAPPSSADGVIAEAADALRRDPVYVDGSAERAISSSEAAALRRQVRESGEAIFIAVLPGSAAEEVGGEPGDVPRALSEAIDLQGAVAVVVGRSFRAGGSPSAAGLATEAFQAEGANGTAAVLSRFIEGVSGEEAAGDVREAVGRDDGRGGGGGGLPGWLLPAALVGGGLWWLSRRRRRVAEATAQRREMTAEVEALRASAQLLGEDVLQLEPHVSVTPAARGDYEAALSRFRFVEAVLPNVDTDEEVARTQRVLDEGHYAMARAKAVVEGREPPPPPPVLARPGAHAEPALTLDDRGEPAYAGYGGPFYGGGGGWFGGGGGLLTGLLLGQVLGGGWGWGGGWGGGYGAGLGGGWGNGSGDGGGGGGGGWDGGGGGGDWGGDIGGGDWGGDIGGGDWGGDIGGGDW